MKKIMLSAAMLAFAGMATVNAENINFQTATELVSNLQDKTPVNAEDLPDAIKTKLAGDEYSGWAVKEAFSVQSASGAYYEISLQKDDENRVINLNEAGDVAEPATSSDVTPTEQAVPTDQTPTEQPTEETTPIEEPVQ